MVGKLMQASPRRSDGGANLLNRICGGASAFSAERQYLNWITIFTAGVCFLSAVWNRVVGIPDLAPLLIGGVVWFGIYLVTRFRDAPVVLIANVVLVLTVFELTAGWFANDGMDGSTLLFCISAVVAALSLFKGRPRILWMCILFGQVAVLIAIQYLQPDWITPYPSGAIRHSDLIFSYSLMAVYMLGYVGINLYNLDARRKVADELLLNVLPNVIAERLKYSPTRVLAENYPNASVLFADIVGFTPMSAKLTPGEVVDLLNSVFSYFDNLTDKYDLEKIKTIGDCYMVAAGVPTERINHAQVLIRMALEMRDYVTTQGFLGKQLHLRIGINSGPLVAGVIGHKKFSYDLWGDTVNTASRMESHGQPNAIQITRNTYDLIKNDFICEPQGYVDVKGKGQMEVWYVVGARPDSPISRA